MRKFLVALLILALALIIESNSELLKWEVVCAIALLSAILINWIGVKRQKRVSVRFMILASQLNGISEEETQCIEAICKKNHISHEEYLKICDEIKNNSKIVLPEYPGERVKILKNIAKIIKADGVVTDEEKSFLTSIGEKLELENEIIQNIKNNL